MFLRVLRWTKRASAWFHYMRPGASHRRLPAIGVSCRTPLIDISLGDNERARKVPVSSKRASICLASRRFTRFKLVAHLLNACSKGFNQLLLMRSNRLEVLLLLR